MVLRKARTRFQVEMELRARTMKRTELFPVVSQVNTETTSAFHTVDSQPKSENMLIFITLPF